MRQSDMQTARPAKQKFFFPTTPRAILISLIAVGFFQADRLRGVTQDDALRITGKIDNVVVFSDRALVRKTEEITLQKNESIIRFVRLPATMQGDSVRAAAQGVTISSVSVRTVPPGEDSELTNDPLKKKMIQLEREIRAETDRQVSYKDQLKMIASLAELNTTQTKDDVKRNAIDIKAWATSLEFLETKRLDYLAKIQKSEQTIEALRKEYQKTSAAFSQMANAKRWSNSEVEVVLKGTPGAKGKVEIQYLVTGVSWKGIYDLHGSSEGGDFRLESRAALRQYTGEDWNNVEIMLSSARPSIGISLGTLKPWRVRPGSLTMPKESKNEDARGDAAIGGESSSEDGNDQANFTFLLPQRESVPSDNSDHRVTIDTAQIKGTLSHVAIPRLSSYVFLKAKLRNTSKMPLMWNSVNVFMDGSFIGSSTPGHRAAVGQEFEMYLGPDQRMQVKRSLLKGDVAGAGILSKSVQIDNQWQIEISNYTKKARPVIVIDQYPVAADPSVSTTFQGSSISEVKKDANGILTWTLNVKPGDTQKFDFAYSMSIPRDMWQTFERQMEEAEDNLNDMTPQQDAPRAQKKMYNLEKMFMQ